MTFYSNDIGNNRGGKQAVEITTENIKGRLKWFNGPKGYGFVIPEGYEDGERDAFLHATTLIRAGITALGEEAVMECLISFSGKGATVHEVLGLLDIGKRPNPIPSREDLDTDQEMKMDGTVKWYKPEKGFGFIIPEDGLKDVFIHQSCLDRHGVETLSSGQRLRMTVKAVPKGREVDKFELYNSN